jgi:hypothetical protein
MRNGGIENSGLMGFSFFHFTDVSNLTSILAYNKLLSARELTRANVQHKVIADSTILDISKEYESGIQLTMDEASFYGLKFIPSKSNLNIMQTSIHDNVRFFFQPSSL